MKRVALRGRANAKHYRHGRQLDFERRKRHVLSTIELVAFALSQFNPNDGNRLRLRGCITTANNSRRISAMLAAICG